MGWSRDEAACFFIELGAQTAFVEFERARIVTVKYDTYVRCSSLILSSSIFFIDHDVVVREVGSPNSTVRVISTQSHTTPYIARCRSDNHLCFIAQRFLTEDLRSYSFSSQCFFLTHPAYRAVKRSVPHPSRYNLISVESNFQGLFRTFRDQ